MGGITKEYNALTVVPRVATRSDQRAGRVGCPIAFKVWQVLQHIGEVLFEITTSRLGVFDAGKGVFAFVRGEQRAGKSAVGIRQGHEHEVPAWPNVQRLRVDGKVTIGIGGHGDLFVAVLQIELAKIKPVCSHHPRPYRTEGTVCPKNPTVPDGLAVAEVQRHLVIRFGKILECVVKLDLNQAGGFGLFQEDPIERAARYRIDALIVAESTASGQSIGLIGEHTRLIVHATGFDRHGDLANSLECAGDLKGAPTPFAQGKVDGAACGIAHFTRV